MSTAALQPESPAAQSSAATSTPAHKPSTGYDVARPLGRCRVSNRVIAPDEKFMAALIETPQGFERADVSLECWEGFDRANIIAFWQAVMPRHEAKKKVFVDDTVLCELFERLADAAEEPKLHFRFVLGLVLMRKRLIIYETTQMQGDREIWRVRIKGRDEVLELLNPKLSEQQVVDVSQQLGQILSQEL